MPCYHPLTAWYSANKNSSGKRSLQFSAAGGFGLPIEIACGQCIGCRLERSRQWAIRCVHEAQYHDESSFLTLTYSDENLPENGVLVPRHLQLFLKRLRRALSPGRIRYFACGEYGETTARPHYHVLLFGHAFLGDRRVHTRGDFGETWTSETLERIWGLGHCVIGSLTTDSAGYTARYSLKKVNGKEADKHYTRVNPKTGEIFRAPPEFIRMSLKDGGIAGRWFDEFSSDLYPDDFVVQKGKKLRVPRFYDNRLDPALLVEIKAERRKRARNFKANNTPERLRVRELVKESQIKNLTRAKI